MSYLINHLLEASAQERPDGIAVQEGEHSITYGELDRRANQLANVLLELGVSRGDRVAIYLEKSIAALQAIYAVLKAGAGYVPLDPGAPPARLAYIARNAGARVLLTAAEKSGAWGPLVTDGAGIESIVVLGADGADPPASVRLVTATDVGAAPSAAPEVRVVDSDLAYILYTSGSTGIPKGVMLTHRNCLAFVEWAAREFAISSEDRLSSHAPLHFDLSTFDLFAAALAGARLVLVPPSVSVFPAQVRTFIETTGISVWYSVPSILSMLVLRGGLQVGELPRLRTVLFAGEVFPTVHLRRLVELLPHVRFANLYGPTETNVCTWWEVAGLAEDSDETIPIGRAITNVDVFAVTDDDRRAAPGESGELCVRGPTVMQGYLGDPDKTASRLVPDPLGGVLGQRVYRTGDIVEEAPDGNYRFLGRRDGQIKSRGYRIELGDVEAALHAHPSVLECAVVPVPDDLVGNRLSAYVATREEVSGPELAAFCAARIPAYMIPEAFELADALPRTSTGKIDRTALAALAGAAATGERPPAGGERRAPGEPRRPAGPPPDP